MTIFSKKQREVLRPPNPEETQEILDRVESLSAQFDKDSDLQERYENNFYLYLFDELRECRVENIQNTEQDDWPTKLW